MQINQSSVIERKGIYSNISEINKNKQYILFVLPLILYVIQLNKKTKRKSTRGQTTIHKTLHRKLKIEQHEPH
jgi:hypothetical protein